MIKFFQTIYTIYAAILFAGLMMILGLFIVIPVMISDKGDRISFFLRFPYWLPQKCKKIFLAFV